MLMKKEGCIVNNSEIVTYHGSKDDCNCLHLRPARGAARLLSVIVVLGTNKCIHGT